MWGERLLLSVGAPVCETAMKLERDRRGNDIMAISYLPRFSALRV